MRTSSRRVAGSAVAVVALLTLAGCNTDDLKDAGSDAASAGVSAAASKAAEAAPTVIPDDVLKQLPGNLTQEQALQAMTTGILVTTQSGQDCQSKPLTEGADQVYILAGKLKPDTVYNVKVSLGDKVLIGDMRITAMSDDVAGTGALGEGHFSCEGWKAGHYTVDISTGTGSSLYAVTAGVQ